MQRGYDEVRTQGLYRLKFRKADWCLYCGGPRQCLDHVFPVSRAVGLRRGLGVRRELGPHGLCRVPSCLNCNALAGPKVFTSIRSKRAFIQDRIKKKYKIESTMWTEEELEELSPLLRSYVERKEAETDENWFRAFWPRSRKLYRERFRWK